MYHEHEKRYFGFGGKPETDTEAQCKRGVRAVKKGRPLTAFFTLRAKKSIPGREKSVFASSPAIPVACYR